MKKWLSWSAIAAFAAAGAACNGAVVPVGQETGDDGGTHNTSGCTGTDPTCPAYCHGIVPAAPGQCLSGTWTCIEPSCPADPDGGPGTPDASSGCSATPPVCGPCPNGYPPIEPTCIQGQWECGDECAGTVDGGDDGAPSYDDGGFDDGSSDDGNFLPEDAGPTCIGTTPTCAADCDGIVPPGPAVCQEGVWTCLGASCPAPEDASVVPCNGNAPTCAPGCEGTVYYPSCLNGQWSCVAPTC
jgi:hypothetical protein